jgi:hypothetical protein
VRNCAVWEASLKLTFLLLDVHRIDNLVERVERAVGMGSTSNRHHISTYELIFSSSP